MGIILAVMGSAIGLGNFLRFPGLAAKYEGGSFMIPYFVALILLGLPIAWTEWSIGRKGGEHGYHSSPGIFRALWNTKASPYFGFLGLLVPVGIYMYYVFIEAWCLYYAFQYVSGGFPLGTGAEGYQTFFAGFTGMNENGSLFADGLAPIIYILIGCFILNFFIIFRGLAKGIETVSKIGIPVLFVSAILILARVLTLGTPDPSMPDRNVLNALGFMWNPKTDEAGFLESLGNAEMWMEAAGQIFFSLSVGFGVIITYASYLKKRDDVLLSGTTSASGNIFAEVALGGMITIPAAFIFLGPAAAGGSSFDLGFITLPVVFEFMPLGALFGFLWFFLLFLAAITSSLSMLQGAIAFFEEGLGLDRKGSVSILAFITFTGSMFVVIFSKDLIALDNMDFWVGTFGIFVLALAQVLVAGWVYGAYNVLHDANESSIIKLPVIVAFIIKYVSPVYLLTIFILWLTQNVGKYADIFREVEAARYTIFFIIILSAFFLLTIAVAVQRWKKKEREQV